MKISAEWLSEYSNDLKWLEFILFDVNHAKSEKDFWSWRSHQAGLTDDIIYMQ